MRKWSSPGTESRCPIKIAELGRVVAPGDLDSEEKTIVLWQDLNSVPATQQRCSVNEVSEFWMRVMVTTPYATAPVGTQVTAVPDARHLQVTK